MSDIPTAETPSAQTAPVETTPPETVPVGESAPDPVGAPARARRTVLVPVWVLVVGMAVVLAVGAFLVGRATAPSGDSGPKTLAEAVEQTASGELAVGEFDTATLLEALSQNQDLDLGPLGRRILRELGRR